MELYCRHNLLSCSLNSGVSVQGQAKESGTRSATEFPTGFIRIEGFRSKTAQSIVVPRIKYSDKSQSGYKQSIEKESLGEE